MEREAKEGAGAVNVLSSRPNGRTGVSQLVINRGPQRKSLFTRRESKENLGVDMPASGRLARPTSPGSSSDTHAPSPDTSRVPRPSQQQPLSHTRRPLTLTEAYRMAEEEEDAAARGSPSPAPRQWRAKADSEERRRMQKLLAGGPLDLGVRRRQARVSLDSADDTQSSVSIKSGPRRSNGSDSDIEQKLRQYEQDQQRMAAVRGGRNGAFTKGRPGAGISDDGADQAAKTDVDGDSPGRGGRRIWGNKARPNPHWLRRGMSESEKGDVPRLDDASNPANWEGATRDVPVPSIEKDPAASPHERPAMVPPADRSPDKSFAWQADADFTAGDLQVSNSPPVKLERSSRRGDSDANTADPGVPFPGASRPRPSNTKLDEIRQLEIEAAQKYPHEPDPPVAEAAEAPAPAPASPKDERESWKNRFIRRSNRRIDDIRAREIESLSKRALAAARLDEIRERNSN